MYCFLSGGYNHGGGAQTIQLLLFKSLTKRGKKCKLFDVKDGSVHNAFLDTNIPFEFIEIDEPRSKRDYSKCLNETDLLIVFDTNLFGNLLYFSRSKCKILVWEIYYLWVERFIYTKYFPLKWWALHQERKILNEIVKNNAFFFIDYMGKEAVETRLNVSISDNFYLPIPIEMPKCNKLIRQNLKSNLTVTYVGRSVIWKINPFIKIASDFNEIGYLNSVNFIVVCDDIQKFKSELRKKLSFYDMLTIKFFENLSLEQLNNSLEKSDLHFAMGTAALDGAKLGIPTIVVDGSFYDFPTNYRYRWIFETKELNLGKALDYKEVQDVDGKHILSEVLSTLKHNRNSISSKSFEYVKNNYDIEKVTDKIMAYEVSAQLTFASFNSMFIAKYFKMLRRLGIR